MGDGDGDAVLDVRCNGDTGGGAMSKEYPDRVYPAMARRVMAKAKLRTHLYSDYIVAHFRATGNLAPGCDARDLMAWYEQNMPEELAAITSPPGGFKRARGILPLKEGAEPSEVVIRRGRDDD